MAQQVDPDILEIFVEEAEEVLEGIADEVGNAFPVSGLKSAKLATLCRHFHTLKGGARMAGAESIGDMARALEDLLHKVIGGSVVVADDPLQQLVEDAAAQVPLMIADLQAGREHSNAWREVTKRADALLGRVTAEPEAPAVVPAAAETEVPVVEAAVEVAAPVAVAPVQDTVAPTRIAELEAALAEARAALAEARARADELAVTVKELRNSNSALQESQLELQINSTEMQKWNDSLLKRHDELQHHHDNLQHQLVALQETHAAKVTALAQAEGERMRVSTELATQKTRNAELATALAEAQAEIARRAGLWQWLQKGLRRILRR